MTDLVFISFPSESKAEEVRQKILDMQKDYLIEVGDAVIATKDEQGRVKLNQLVHTTATGAAGGALWGTLIGMLFLMPLAGTAIGAATGALGGALTDFGINDDQMKKAAQALKPGGGRPVPAHPQDDNRQSSGRPQGGRWNGREHFLRPYKGGAVEGGPRAGRPGIMMLQ